MPIAWKSSETLEAKIQRIGGLRASIADLQQALDVLQHDLGLEQAKCLHEIADTTVKDAPVCAICGAKLDPKSVVS